MKSNKPFNINVYGTSKPFFDKAHFYHKNAINININTFVRFSLFSMLNFPEIHFKSLNHIENTSFHRKPVK